MRGERESPGVAKKRGASLIEYMLLAWLIAVVIIGALQFIGRQAQDAGDPMSGHGPGHHF